MHPTSSAAGDGYNRLWAAFRRMTATPECLGALPHMWLIFLGFFLAHMWQMDILSIRFGLCLLALIIFIPTYYAAFRREGRAMYKPIAIITMLGLVMTPVNFGSTVFFNYAAHLSGQAMSGRRAVLAVVLMCAWMLAATFALSLPFWYAGPGILVSLGLVGMSISDRRRQLADSALRRSRQEVQQLAQMAERERIARDLHDVLGHTLSVITLKAELAGKLVDSNPEQARTELEQIADTSRAALSSVRETVSGYRRVGLDEQIEDTRDSLKSVGVHFTTDVESIHLRPREETLLALVLREAVTNVLRHANASACHVSIRRDNKDILMRVSDNGQGFDSDEGQGLTGMRERLAVLGGVLTIQSNDGTQLDVRLPGAGRPPA